MQSRVHASACARASTEGCAPGPSRASRSLWRCTSPAASPRLPSPLGALHKTRAQADRKSFPGTFCTGRCSVIVPEAGKSVAFPPCVTYKHTNSYTGPGCQVNAPRVGCGPCFGIGCVNRCRRLLPPPPSHIASLHASPAPPAPSAVQSGRCVVESRAALGWVPCVRAQHVLVQAR